MLPFCFLGHGPTHLNSAKAEQKGNVQHQPITVLQRHSSRESTLYMAIDRINHNQIEQALSNIFKKGIVQVSGGVGNDNVRMVLQFVHAFCVAFGYVELNLVSDYLIDNARIGLRVALAFFRAFGSGVLNLVSGCQRFNVAHGQPPFAVFQLACKYLGRKIYRTHFAL